MARSTRTTSHVSSPPTVPPHIPESKPIIQEAGRAGHQVLWVVAILMLLSCLTCYLLAFRAPVQKRMFHVLVSLITTISFLVYFAMATGDGIALVHLSPHGDWPIPPTAIRDVYREVYWARFLNWGLTSPLILICLALLAGLNGASLLVGVSANVIMFLSGVISAFGGPHGRRWAWYTISCIAYLTVVYQIGYHGGRAVRAKDPQIRTFFSTICTYSLILMVGYPIIWAASTHSRRMSVDAEIITFAILDILSQAVFGLWLLITHDRMQSKTMAIDGFWVIGVNTEGGIRIGEEEGA